MYIETMEYYCTRNSVPATGNVELNNINWTIRCAMTWMLTELAILSSSELRTLVKLSEYIMNVQG